MARALARRHRNVVHYSRNCARPIRRAPFAGAQVSAVNRLGVARQTTTDQAGGFTLKLSETGEMHLAITAPGFETKNIPLAGRPPGAADGAFEYRAAGGFGARGGVRRSTCR